MVTGVIEDIHKMEFAYRLQSNEEYKDFTEKLLFYLESIYEKDRAIWIGKMAIGLAKNKITLEQFDLSVFAINNSMPGDLILLQKIFKDGLSERVNERYSGRDGHWYCNYLYQTIPLRYWDNAGENQTLPKRTMNSFISIGLLERELKEVRTSNRDLGLDGGASFLEGYKEIHTFSEIALLIYLLALKTNL